MDEILTPIEIIRNSKCKDCIHRLTRVVEPVLKEDREYYISMLDIDDSNDYDISIEQNICLLTDEELDGVIRECSRYEPERKCLLLKDYIY